MKRLGLLAAVLLLSGCERNFNDLLSDAQASFVQKNYTQVIDDVNLALPRWRQKDGADKKSAAYELLGKSYHALEKTDQAADAYKQAVKLSNNAYDSAYALGVMDLASSQVTQAKESFEMALRMKKDDPLALLGLGDSLYALKQYAEAKAIYKRVLEVSPGVTDALANLKLLDKKSNARSTTPVNKKNPSRKRRR